MLHAIHILVTRYLHNEKHIKKKKSESFQLVGEYVVIFDWLRKTEKVSDVIPPSSSGFCLQVHSVHRIITPYPLLLFPLPAYGILWHGCHPYDQGVLKDR
jgi:hypothetical protein